MKNLVHLKEFVTYIQCFKLKAIAKPAIVALLMPCFFLFPFDFGYTNETPNKTQIDAFLESMVGHWKGEAVESPIGLREYDIHFSKGEGGHVKGQAELSASIHYWDFSQKNNMLKLNFLSTFRGNQTPILFEARTITRQGVVFNSVSRDNVQVIVKTDPKEMVIQIRLYNKPHVRIELLRLN